MRVAILSVKGTKNEGVPLPFFEVIHMKCLSSLHSILEENDSAIHIPSNVAVHDIAMKVNHWHSLLPISMVDLVNDNPWFLWIINSQAILRGICFLLLQFIDGINMCFD